MTNCFVLLKNKLIRHGDFFRYLLVGGVNTLLDITLFTILANTAGLYPIIANVISTIIVLSISFFLNYYFVFKSKNSKLKAALQFVGVTLFNGWVLQSLVIFAVINLGTNLITDENVLNFTAKILGVGVGMISNFLCYRFIFNDVKNQLRW